MIVLRDESGRFPATFADDHYLPDLKHEHVKVVAQLPQWVDVGWYHDLVRRVGHEVKGGWVLDNWNSLGGDLRDAVDRCIREALITISDSTLDRLELQAELENRVTKKPLSALPQSVRLYMEALLDEHVEIGVLFDSPAYDALRYAEGEHLDVRKLRRKLGKRSRRTVDHAINSPIGHLTDGLMEILAGFSLAEGSGLPAGVSGRLDTLMRAPGEGADYAVCLMTRQLRWLHWLDPKWTVTELIPLFAIGHDLYEPAWNGLLQDSQVPGPRLFALLKRDFLNAFESVNLWDWDDHIRNKLVEFLIVACLWRREDKAYVSLGEARTALRIVDDSSRSHALWFLAELVEKPGTWASFARRFLQRAWPRESRYQTPNVTRQLAFLAERSADDFPDVVKAILPLIVPTEQLDFTVHLMAEQSESSPSRRFPESMLQLLDRLVPDDPRPAPYDLGGVLNLIVEASPSLRGDQRWRRLRRIADRG